MGCYPEKWKGYYLTAYGLAVKHGFKGSEEEWLDRLKGANVELRYEQGVLQWKHDEEEAWNTLEEFSQFQAEVLEQARNAQVAADRANAAAGEAGAAGEKAEASAGRADVSAVKADTAAGNADAATEKAAAGTRAAENAAANADAKAQVAQEAATAADTATQEAQAAAGAASKAAEEASASRDAAAEAAQNAQEKVQAAQEAASAASAATNSANSAATAANTAAASAGAAAQNAQAQADYARGQGDRANELLGKIEETDIGGLTADILELQSGKAPVESPVLTGVPKAPTPPVDSKDTQIATTAFVNSVVEQIVNNPYQLEITFHPNLSGKAFSVSGGDFTHNGTAPSAGGKLTVTVPYPNTTYKIICDGSLASVTTTDCFGKYAATVTPLEAYTWAQIAEIAETGEASSHWQIGSEKTVSLTTGEKLTFQIYDFDHDDLAGGGKAGITFGMKNLMAETRQMNSTKTTQGSFVGSDMYNWLKDTIFVALPEELRSFIRPVEKKTSLGSLSETVKAESVELFLFSVVECDRGAVTSSYANVYMEEGETYSIFTDTSSRIKYLADGTGMAKNWWTRSPSGNNLGYFNYFYSNGQNLNAYATVRHGVCFGFCI